MNPDPSDCCELLPWDTDFFGLRIARLKSEVLTPELAAATDAWCHSNQVRCLYFLASADEPSASFLAESNGYHLADIRVTFGKGTDPRLQPQGIRFARAEEVEALAALAAENSGDSRFAFDPRFARDASARLYQRWMERSCLEAMAGAVFVCGEPDAPTGYVTCEREPRPDGSALGKIGLLGLAPEARGKGLGSQLVEAALAWFHATGCERASVVTQGRNVAAQRLYERSGFLTERVQLWYHKWF